MYKHKIYQSYVKNHTLRLYGEVALQDIHKQFYVWDYYYRRIFNEVGNSSKILELGCGNGSFLYYLSKKSFNNLKGIDISVDYLNEGKKLGFSNIFFEDIGDCLSTDEKFDVIIARDVFEHFDKEVAYQMFELIYSKLSKDGRLIIQVPNGHGMFVKMIYFSDFTHDTLYSANSLRQISNTIGFTETMFYGTGPIPKGLSSFFRYVFWKIASFLYRLVYFSETGRLDLITTQNVIAVFKK